MYLLKHASGSYYTRICLPKHLRDVGFPFDIKCSLLTKTRSIAIERNCLTTIRLRQLIANIDSDVKPDDFHTLVHDIIGELRTEWGCKIDSRCLIQRPKHSQKSLSDALNDFISSKQKESIRPLTIRQLRQRISHFTSFMDDMDIIKVGSDDAMRYRDYLLNEDRSYKTNKEYLAAIQQFINWCKNMKLLYSNPFDGINLPKQPIKPHDQHRERWSISDIKRLTSSQLYLQQSHEFRWVTLILLYTGMRPSEVCQLRVIDVDPKKLTINVTNAGNKQFVKNQSSVREVPIHKALLALGLLEYVSGRTKAGAMQLFNYKPSGINNEWSKQYCKSLAKIQCSLEMKAHQRPTAYSFRHTFIDELKQLGHPEAMIAQLVGHTGQSQTFNRYGKRFRTHLLASVVNSLKYPI